MQNAAGERGSRLGECILLLSSQAGIVRGMPAPDGRTPARGALDEFIRNLADRQFAVTTRRIRRHYLEEYLHHAQQATGAIEITLGELLDPARTDAWLCDAAAGRTRTRNTLRGPDAAAYANSMRVRIDSYNAFADFLGRPDRRDNQPPARGYYLTPADTERLLRDLAARRPVHANAVTCLRTAAVAALVAETGRSVPELAGLGVRALHLDGEARVDLRRRQLPARRRHGADPHPVARSPGGDHRRTAGQRPWPLVDSDQARTAPRRPRRR